MTIFNNSVSDVEGVIISFCDIYRLINLSGVNRAAYHLVLSNKEFFKDLFSFQHSILKSYASKLFTTLRTCYSDNCYKVMCKVMKEGVFKCNTPFLKQAIPYLEEKLTSKKEQLEQKIEEEDSLVDIVRNEYKKSEEEIKTLTIMYTHEREIAHRRIAQLTEPLKAVHSREELDKILFLIFNDAELLLAISDEEFINLPDEMLESMDKEHLVQYQEIALTYLSSSELSHKISEKISNNIKLEKQYKILKEKTKKVKKEIQKIDAEIKAVSSGSEAPLKDHRSNLSREGYFALYLEESLQKVSHLTQCMRSIQDLIDHPEKKTTEALEAIRLAINACTHDDKTVIWGNLYLRCANGVIEDAWSEHHFPDFLTELKSQVNNVLMKHQQGVERSEKELEHVEAEEL